jgi:hypothetical protein
VTYCLVKVLCSVYCSNNVHAMCSYTKMKMICGTQCVGLAEWKKGKFKWGCGIRVREKLPPPPKKKNILLFYMKICVLNGFVLTRFVDSLF